MKEEKMIINGIEYIISGKNVTIKKGSVYVNGKIVENGLDKNITIEFIGNPMNLKVYGDLVITGRVQGDVTCSGNVKCGDIYQDVYVDKGNVITSRIYGDVRASEGKALIV